MAKKKAPKKKPVAKQAPSKKAAPKAKAAKSARQRIASPRSMPLPGMEQVTNRSLNHICECISDSQREMNRLVAEVEDLHRQAQDVMEQSKPLIEIYVFGGVELRLRKGTTKLSVRILKNKTEKTAPKSEPAPDNAGVTADETGDGATDNDAEPFA